MHEYATKVKLESERLKPLITDSLVRFRETTKPDLRLYNKIDIA